MKLNKLFLAGFCIPFLLGCAGKAKYDGAKIVLSYDEHGTLVSTTATTMYSLIYTLKSSQVFILGNDQCGSCKSAKQTLKEYSEKNHCNTYYINVKDLSKDDLTKIQKCTAGDSMFGEKDTVPAIYFFYQGDVAFRCGDSELKDRLDTYVTVGEPSGIN